MSVGLTLSEHGGDTCPSQPNHLHLKSFKLRFASQRELGRSYVSAVKPLGLPPVVRAKECVSGIGTGTDESEADERALRRVQALFRRGPREKYPAPLTSAHEYGWWVTTDVCGGAPAEMRHNIRDSAWLKERLRVLAADGGLQRR